MIVDLSESKCGRSHAYADLASLFAGALVPFDQSSFQCRKRADDATRGRPATKTAVQPVGGCLFSMETAKHISKLSDAPLNVRDAMAHQ